MPTKKPRLIITKTLPPVPTTAQPPPPTSNRPSWGGGTPACTRFNNKTWQEYQDWMIKHQEAYEQIYQRPLKCIYGSPREISHKKIPIDAKILVIEMNNDENRIMGIGEIQNKTASEAYRTTRAPMKFNIFSDRNYTRYIYIGNSHYATREELERNHTADAQYINEQLTHIKMPQTPQQQPQQQQTIIQSLERLLFKGARHMKRGSGITMLSCCVAPFVSTKLTSATPQLRANAAQVQVEKQGTKS